MEEKKRKSSRSFELEKGGKRSFDLNKTSARKFDLAKESDDVSLEDLKKDLLADGKIDAEEVNKLREARLTMKRLISSLNSMMPLVVSLMTPVGTNSL